MAIVTLKKMSQCEIAFHLFSHYRINWRRALRIVKNDQSSDPIHKHFWSTQIKKVVAQRASYQPKR